MFKKLLEYNWRIFRHSLKGTKVFVFTVYVLFLGLIFSQIISTIFVIVTLQQGELDAMFDWYTPERGRFILLGFTNFLWLAQFFFTNIRLMKLRENRKLLTMGYPARKLSQYLTVLTFFHPLNILFNLTWLSLLQLQFQSLSFLPLSLVLVGLNFSLIFSAKFRVLRVIKNYQKWMLVLALCVLFMLSISVNQVFSSTFFTKIEHYIPWINQWAIIFPGGLLTEAHLVLQPLPLQIGAIALGGMLIFLLHRDHLQNTLNGLQTPSREETPKGKVGWLRGWLCTQCGNHAGKYLYYVITHPYNKFQALLFVVFPILYVPFMLSRMDEPGTSRFIVLFFFMYAPMGFQLIFLGNMFGYEHRELLKEMQFPIPIKIQLKQRLQGALIIPLTLLVIVSGAEMLLLKNGNLFTAVLGNILIFEIFVVIFLWSTVNRLKVVEWVSFSFSQPVISQPVQFITGLLMMILSAAIYISYGPYEFYKQMVMLGMVTAFGFWIHRYIYNIEQAFTTKIRPQLWTEL